LTVESFKARVRSMLDPVTRVLSRAGIHPSMLTLGGLVISAAAGLAYAKGYFPLGGGLVLLAGLCDMTDGSVARATGKISSFGAFLDSSVDRYSELFIYLGLGMYYFRNQRLEWIAVVLALSGSLLVSYTRARAEGLGEECRVGWVQRPERMAILILASLFGARATGWSLWLLAVLSHLTAAQRIRHVYLLMNKPDLGRDASRTMGCGAERL
jgi:CDP-diacylglycerol--glycerol-3-phosphate 3-phosphatidyltransferase